MANHPVTVNVAPSPAPQPVASNPELLEAFKAIQEELKEVKQTLANHSIRSEPASRCTHTEGKGAWSLIYANKQRTLLGSKIHTGRFITA